MKPGLQIRITVPDYEVTEHFWNALLDRIEDHTIVPVLGQELLVVEVDGRAEPLDHFVVRRALEGLGLPAGDQPPSSLGAAATHQATKAQAL